MTDWRNWLFLLAFLAGVAGAFLLVYLYYTAGGNPPDDADLKPPPASAVPVAGENGFSILSELGEGKWLEDPDLNQMEQRALSDPWDPQVARKVLERRARPSRGSMRRSMPRGFNARSSGVSRTPPPQCLGGPGAWPRA